MCYKFLKISTLYSENLKYYYSTFKNITSEDYQTQYLHLMNQGYMWADYFAKNLRNLGVEAFEIVQNAYPLQKAWAQQYGFPNNNQILFTQLKYYKPDVVMLQDPRQFSPAFLETIKDTIPSIKLLIGFLCSPYTQEQVDFYKNFDFMLLCSPGFCKSFERFGIKNYLFYHAFEDTLIDKLHPNFSPESDILFVGSFIPSNDFHDSRIRIIEKMLEQDMPITIYNNTPIDSNGKLFAKQGLYYLIKGMRIAGADKQMFSIPYLKKIAQLNDKPKRIKFSDNFKKHQVRKSVYGLDMYKLLAKTKIGFNSHGGIAGEYAANIRMFETTGCGALLLTDYKQNISDLFEPDYEVITYKSSSEAIDKAIWLLNHAPEREKIAKAGQQRTLKDHSFKNRLALLHEIVTNELKRK